MNEDVCPKIKPAQPTIRFSISHTCSRPKDHFGYCECAICGEDWNGNDYA